LKDIQKLIKVDVKIVSDHPYPWHPETASGGSTKPKIQTEVAELINQKVRRLKAK
jgi:hypothetical protein